MNVKESLERNRKAYENFSGEKSETTSGGTVPQSYKNTREEFADNMRNTLNMRNNPDNANPANITENQGGPVYSLGSVKAPVFTDITGELLKRLDDDSRLGAQMMEED